MWSQELGLTRNLFQDEAIQKQSMIPLQLYTSSASSLNSSRWTVIDPGSLSPWSVMSWSLKQLKGFIIGSEDGISTMNIQVQKLVLIDNLKVSAYFL